MDQKKETKETMVINLFDDRILTYELPPDKAVVAAYEESAGSSSLDWNDGNPAEHPFFKEYRRGFACGDWVAFKYPRECLIYR